MTFTGKAKTVFAIAVGVAVAIGMPAGALGQNEEADLVTRLDQMERQIRQLTGTVEELQFRNQQLDEQVKRLTGEQDGRAQEGPRGGIRPSGQQMRPGAIPPPVGAPLPAPTAAAPILPPPPPAAPIATPQVPAVSSGGRRGDAFDPSLNPSAPGAPRQLAPPGQRSENYENAYPPASTAQADIGGLPPSRDPALAGQVAALPPSQLPRDEYDLAYGYFLRKDYPQAERGLRQFLASHPSDRLAGDAQFWLGETLFQQRNYREAADAFVVMSKKHDHHAKAPDSLLRLGQSLMALNERELACATFSEIPRKYPRAPLAVKQAGEREQKRGRC
jgi:tol-pal system protein YbgF